MPKPSPLVAEHFTFLFYKRNLPKGELFYARLFQKGKTPVLAESTRNALGFCGIYDFNPDRQKTIPETSRQ